MLKRIKSYFTESIQIQIAATEALPNAIVHAANLLTQALLNDKKILCCSNGISAANTQHFSACMLNHFEAARPSLSAVALNTDTVVLIAIINDRQQNEIYAKQIRALGQVSNILLAISTSGNSCDIMKAVKAAVTCKIITLTTLTSYNGGIFAGLLGQQDVEIRISSHRCAQIQEIHMLTVNCLCDLIDNKLFPHLED